VTGMDEKRVIEVDEYQHGLIINSLNDKRNELVEQGKDTEFVDDTLIEVMDAPMKREKKRHRDERER
jgi:hypothetical protein